MVYGIVWFGIVKQFFIVPHLIVSPSVLDMYIFPMSLCPFTVLHGLVLFYDMQYSLVKSCIVLYVTVLSCGMAAYNLVWCCRGVMVFCVHVWSCKILFVP